MTEEEQRPSESPLWSERGVTNISSTVVSTIAGMSVQEVEGVHMGGAASRSAGGIMGSITGSSGQTRGVSVEVGSFETAIDLKMGIEYGKNILGTVSEVRQKITERIQSMTGLKVTELNVTIADVVFPENGDTPARTPSRTGPDFDTRASSTRETSSGDSETRQTERPSQIREREATPVEPRSRTHTEGQSGPVPEEEVRAADKPVEEDETRRLRFEDDRVKEVASRPDEAGHENVEAESTEASEAPTDETTLTGGTSSGERAARETASGEGSTEDDRTQEIDRQKASEAEDRRSRRQRREEDG